MMGLPKNIFPKHKTNHIGAWAKNRSDKGQAIVLVALVFIGLAAFTGLVVDVGTVLLRFAQLRRAVDAAGVQAANQFREFRDVYTGNGDDMYSSAEQVFAAQGGDATKLRLSACINGSIVSSPAVGHDATDAELIPQLCFSPPRKLVRVDAWTDVGLPFLSIIGFRSIPLVANTISEAATVDLVLVLDRSASMSSTSGVPSDLCAPKNCYPFEDVRGNAKTLVSRLKFPYDHVAIIAFDRVARIYNPSAGTFDPWSSGLDLSGTEFMMSDKASVDDALENKFTIELDHLCPGITAATPTGMESYCMNTNIGGALRAATTLLAVKGRLRGALWMMLLLTDGAPNATDTDWGQNFTSGFCPPQTWPPGPPIAANGPYTIPGYVGQSYGIAPYANSLCLRINYQPGVGDLPYNQIQRACIFTDTNRCGPGTTIYDKNGLLFKYDAVDFARDMADYMSSNGIVAFVIGLGPQVSDANNTSMADGTPGRDKNAGERLLRYIADVGTQPNTWQCQSNYWANTEYPTKQQCGNYWYAAQGSALQAIFDAIANRIFTRITH
jgi:hypothetical protein